MARVRYGARTEAEITAARTASSKLPDIWSTGVVAVWESDPTRWPRRSRRRSCPPPAPGAGQHQQGRPAGLLLGAGSVAVAAEHGEWPAGIRSSCR
ncbi:hypothetical protein [Streptomyces sp. KL116D]|uniref:hypothetical protein n=1 Tax=Streptomyces sp. KL116D TaxID=3045152 RepID=UPI0035584165